MKRSLNEHQLRDLVRARMTKGSAFSCKTHLEYQMMQDKAIAKLAPLSKQQIIERYPEYCYDIK